MNYTIPGSLLTDQSASSRLQLQHLAMAVWSTYQAAAAAGVALTEAAWRAVWDWQATPGDATQHHACHHMHCHFCSDKQPVTLGGLQAAL